MNINPGELKHRIQIIRRDRTADADGYDTIAETVVHTCSAKLTQVSGTELVQANADFARRRRSAMICLRLQFIWCRYTFSHRAERMCCLCESSYATRCSLLDLPHRRWKMHQMR